MQVVMRRFFQVLILGMLGSLVVTAGDHWALRPVVRKEVPAHAAADPVSWFVGEKLRRAGLQIAPPGARRDWVRRLYCNLTGLPPGYGRLAEHVAFPGDDRSLAAEVVDELLSSPHYGER